MHEAAYWLGFVGAWFLFLGPVYQSALELREEEQARTSLQRAEARTDPPPRVPLRWWLLPPAAIVLVLRRRSEHVRLVDAALTEEDRTSIEHYQRVAMGWWFVGFGAWLIFLKESAELAEHREWSDATFWLLVLLMTLLAAGVAGAGGQRDARRRQHRRRPAQLTTSPGDGPRSAAGR